MCVLHCSTYLCLGMCMDDLICSVLLLTLYVLCPVCIVLFIMLGLGMFTMGIMWRLGYAFTCLYFYLLLFTCYTFLYIPFYSFIITFTLIYLYLLLFTYDTFRYFYLYLLSFPCTLFCYALWALFSYLDHSYIVWMFVVLCSMLSGWICS